MAQLELQRSPKLQGAEVWLEQLIGPRKGTEISFDVQTKTYRIEFRMQSEDESTPLFRELLRRHKRSERRARAAFVNHYDFIEHLISDGLVFPKEPLNPFVLCALPDFMCSDSVYRRDTDSDRMLVNSLRNIFFYLRTAGTLDLNIVQDTPNMLYQGIFRITEALRQGHCHPYMAQALLAATYFEVTQHLDSPTISLNKESAQIIQEEIDELVQIFHAVYLPQLEELLPEHPDQIENVGPREFGRHVVMNTSVQFMFGLQLFARACQTSEEQYLLPLIRQYLVLFERRCSLPHAEQEHGIPTILLDILTCMRLLPYGKARKNVIEQILQFAQLQGDIQIHEDYIELFRLLRQADRALYNDDHRYYQHMIRPGMEREIRLPAFTIWDVLE